MSKKWLSNEEIDAITAAIYNDCIETIYQDLPETDDDGLTAETKELLQEVGKGEEYIVLDKSTIVLFRNYRVFNSKTCRFLKPVYAGTDFYLYRSNQAYKFSELFEDAGWTYDHDDAVEAYYMNRWDVASPQGYKKLGRDFTWHAQQKLRLKR